MTEFITLRVVRVSRHVSQNAAEDAWLGAEAPARAEVPVAAELLLAEELPVEPELPVEADAPVEAEGPQADSASASAAVINGVASNASRLLVRGVRFMPL
jgi:hypothetical protein